MEQPATGHLDHRPPEAISGWIYGVPHLEEGRAGKASRDAAPGWQRIPSKYHRKTSGPHQMWATDASYFRVSGWGYYYMVTVMDDYSRSIMAWKLQGDMTADPLIQVVQLAIDAPGMTEVPFEDRTRLLTMDLATYPGLSAITWAW